MVIFPEGSVQLTVENVRQRGISPPINRGRPCFYYECAGVVHFVRYGRFIKDTCAWDAAANAWHARAVTEVSAEEYKEVTGKRRQG